MTSYDWYTIISQKPTVDIIFFHRSQSATQPFVEEVPKLIHSFIKPIRLFFLVFLIGYKTYQKRKRPTCPFWQEKTIN